MRVKSMAAQIKAQIKSNERSSNARPKHKA